jgi:hypothetical protein
MTIATKLRKFRKKFERESGTDVSQIEVPLSHVLDDVCRTLELPTSQRRQVLGRRGIAALGRTKARRFLSNPFFTQSSQSE